MTNASAFRRTRAHSVTPAANASQDDVGLAERIARDIQSGVFAPGMWLKQVDLEDRYRCSRPAVRRALDQLAERRLVRHLANRGYYVFEPDDRRTQEILAIRVVLEAGVAADIVDHADPAALERLDACARRFERLVEAGTLPELYDVNLEFHRTLLSLSANDELVGLVDELRRRTSSAPATQWQTRAYLEESAREHHAIVAALARRDVEELRMIIRQHILKPGRR